MKIKIRNDVFETNSSSTHSLTIRNVAKKDSNQEKIKNRVIELENKQDRTIDEEYELGELRKKLDYENNFSFSLKTPIEKLVWFLGIVDNAEGEKGKTIFETEEYDLSSDRGLVRQFKDFLIDAYCELMNVSKEEAIEHIFDERAKFTPYENILKNPETIEQEAKCLIQVDYDFKKFAKGFLDIKTAFKEFVKKQYQANRLKCNKCTRFECDHYFTEGILDDCTCGFEYYSDIYYHLENLKGKQSWKDFAKDFLTENYIVFGQE